MAKKATQENRKRPQLILPINKLELDPQNPRLPEEIQGQGQRQLLEELYRNFNLDELATSMAQNGYFDEEPLVVVPKTLPENLTDCLSDDPKFIRYVEDKCKAFVVVEGNRRLSTVQLLSNDKLKIQIGVTNWPVLEGKIRQDLEYIPVVVYVRRKDVTPYLGVRHIVGIQKWDSFAKARYIAKTVAEGTEMSEIEKDIGGQKGGARKSHIVYKAVEQLEEEYEDFDTKAVKKNFSLLLLAFGQGKIKRFLGLPKKNVDVDLENPVDTDKLGELRQLVTWIFGDGKKLPAIAESRDITSYLSHVVASPDAVKHLRKTNELVDAYDLSDGEEELVLKNLSTANKKLDAANGIIHRHITPEVRNEVEKCFKTIKEMRKRIADV